MTFDLATILENKRKFRQRLAALPIEEKLAMLDALRARALAIRPGQTQSGKVGLHEKPPAYRAKGSQPE